MSKDSNMVANDHSADERPSSRNDASRPIPFTSRLVGRLIWAQVSGVLIPMSRGRANPNRGTVFLFIGNGEEIRIPAKHVLGRFPSLAEGDYVELTFTDKVGPTGKTKRMYNVFRKEQVPEDAQMPYCSGLVRHHESSGLGFVKMGDRRDLIPFTYEVKTSEDLLGNGSAITFQLVKQGNRITAGRIGRDNVTRKIPHPLWVNSLDGSMSLDVQSTALAEFIRQPGSFLSTGELKHSFLPPKLYSVLANRYGLEVDYSAPQQLSQPYAGGPSFISELASKLGCYPDQVSLLQMEEEVLTRKLLDKGLRMGSDDFQREFDAAANQGITALFCPREMEVGRWIKWFATQMEDVELHGLRRRSLALLKIDDRTDVDNLINVHWSAVFSRTRFPSTRVITVFSNPVHELVFDQVSGRLLPGPPSKYMLVEFDTSTAQEVEFHIRGDDTVWEETASSSTQTTDSALRSVVVAGTDRKKLLEAMKLTKCVNIKRMTAWRRTKDYAYYLAEFPSTAEAGLFLNRNCSKENKHPLAAFSYVGFYEDGRALSVESARGISVVQMYRTFDAYSVLPVGDQLWRIIPKSKLNKLVRAAARCNRMDDVGGKRTAFFLIRNDKNQIWPLTTTSPHVLPSYHPTTVSRPESLIMADPEGKQQRQMGPTIYGSATFFPLHSTDEEIRAIVGQIVPEAQLVAVTNDGKLATGFFSLPTPDSVTGFSQRVDTTVGIISLTYIGALAQVPQPTRQSVEEKPNADQVNVPDAVPRNVSNALKSIYAIPAHQWWVKEDGSVLDLMIGDRVISGLGNSNSFETPSEVSLIDLSQLSGHATFRSQIRSGRQARDAKYSDQQGALRDPQVTAEHKEPTEDLDEEPRNMEEEKERKHVPERNNSNNDGASGLHLNEPDTTGSGNGNDGGNPSHMDMDNNDKGNDEEDWGNAPDAPAAEKDAFDGDEPAYMDDEDEYEEDYEGDYEEDYEGDPYYEEDRAELADDYGQQPSRDMQDESWSQSPSSEVDRAWDMDTGDANGSVLQQVPQAQDADGLHDNRKL